MSESTSPARRVRATTVVWGIILVVTAVVTFALLLFDVDFYSTGFAVWTIILIGALLVVAALVGAVVHFFNNRGEAPESGTPPTTD